MTFSELYENYQKFEKLPLPQKLLVQKQMRDDGFMLGATGDTRAQLESNKCFFRSFDQAIKAAAKGID